MISCVTSLRTSWWKLLTLIMMALFVLGGCTTVHINSKPSGADVMASYHRGAFGWTEWGRECQTPCTFTTSNSVQLRIRWSDSTLSEIHQGRYRPFGATYDFNFDKSATTPITSMKNDTNTSVGKAEAAQQPSAVTGEAKIFIGKVDKITQTIHRTSEGPYCKILVVADNGENYTFFVFGTTSVTDSAGKDMTEGGSKLAGILLNKGERIEVRYSTITNGSSITNGQNGATSIRRVPLDYVQQPTVAQTTSKTTEELQTFTGEVKIIEVKHFTQVDGLGLSQEFINSFYDGLRERLAKNNVAGQIIGEGSAVPNTVAANTLMVEGKFTEYKKGGFLEGVGMVGSEIKFYRKSDHALIKIITPRVPFKPSPFNSDNGVGKWTGYSTAYEIKKALK